jgi:IS30 family transposase
MQAGYALTEIARAETRGKDTIRRELRADALKLVERSGARARDAQAEHYRAIARATRLGLPMREIAHAAHVTHGTIRAITNRLATHDTGTDAVDEAPREENPVDQQPREEDTVDQQPAEQDAVDQQPAEEDAVDQQPREQDAVDQQPREEDTLDQRPREEELFAQRRYHELQ